MLIGGATDGQTDATAGRWIDRRDRLGRREFRRDYLRPRRPVVVPGAARDWPASGLFTPEYFRREHAAAAVRVRGRYCRLGELIDQQQASSAARPAPYPCTLVDGSSLLPLLTPRFECSLPNRHTHPQIPPLVFEMIRHVEVFFGAEGGEFPVLHYDMLRMHAWIVQLHGEKEFTLFERGQEHLLYVNPRLPWLSLVQDLRDHARYPLLREARSHTVTLGAGDALFIPCGTWHTARCLGMNITVAFDQLEASNWNEFVAEAVAEQRRGGRRIRALLLEAYLRALGPVLRVAELFGAHCSRRWSQRVYPAAQVQPRPALARA